MVGMREEYNNLLNELREISYNYYINKNGIVVDANGEKVNDDTIIIKTEFYSLYCMAYKDFDEQGEKKETVFDRKFVDRALSSYGIFNYFINICIGEYRIYDDIGTGNVTYIPYQAVADYFFNDKAKKEILMAYLKQELKKQFNNEQERVNK